MSQKQGSSALSRASRSVPIPSLAEAGRELRQGASLCSVWSPSAPTFHLPHCPGMEFLQTSLFSRSHINIILSKHPLLLSSLVPLVPLSFPMETPSSCLMPCADGPCVTLAITVCQWGRYWTRQGLTGPRKKCRKCQTKLRAVALQLILLNFHIMLENHRLELGENGIPRHQSQLKTLSL